MPSFIVGNGNRVCFLKGKNANNFVDKKSKKQRNFFLMTSNLSLHSKVRYWKLNLC